MDLGAGEHGGVVLAGEDAPASLDEGVAGLLGSRRDADDDDPGGRDDVLEGGVGYDDIAVAVQDKPTAEGRVGEQGRRRGVDDGRAEAGEGGGIQTGNLRSGWGLCSNGKIFTAC